MVLTSGTISSYVSLNTVLSYTTEIIMYNDFVSVKLHFFVIFSIPIITYLKYVT